MNLTGYKGGLYHIHGGILRAVCLCTFIFGSCGFPVSVSDRLVNESVSPAKDYIVSIVERDVGATARPSTIIVLRKFDEQLSADDNCRIVVLEGEHAVTVRWDADGAATVILPEAVSRDEIFEQDERCWRQLARIQYVEE